MLRCGTVSGLLLVGGFLKLLFCLPSFLLGGVEVFLAQFVRNFAHEFPGFRCGIGLILRGSGFVFVFLILQRFGFSSEGSLFYLNHFGQLLARFFLCPLSIRVGQLFLLLLKLVRLFCKLLRFFGSLEELFALCVLVFPDDVLQLVRNLFLLLNGLLRGLLLFVQFSREFVLESGEFIQIGGLL